MSEEDDNFLPDEDVDFLREKELSYKLVSENIGAEVRRGIIFPDYRLPSNLHVKVDGSLVPGGAVDLLIIIPKGYTKTRLDSWYLSPGAYLANGQPADRANGESRLFERDWQFWSRHLSAEEWRSDVDGLHTYLNYVRAGLKHP
jgi:hypothetical protein